MKKTVLVFSAIALGSCLLASCGMDTLTDYLNNAPRLISSDTTAINFYPPVDPFEDNFLGIEFSYRIYNNKSKAETDRGLFETRQNAEIVPGASVVSYLLSGSGLKYAKLCYLPSSDSLQVVPLTISNTQITPTSLLSIELRDNNDLFFKNENSETLIYRNLDNIKKFSSIQASDEADVQYDSASGSTTQFYLQIFAFSVGLDFSNFNSLFSKAVFIGLLEL